MDGSAAAEEGAGHLLRYRELDAAGLDGTAEVQAAVGAFRRAVDAASDPAVVPAYTYNLALALQSRYDAVGEPVGDDSDFRAAIGLLEQAVAATEDTRSPYEPALRYGLGAALRRRYQLDRDPDGLRRAVGLLGDALVIGTADSLDQADCMYEYGRGLLTLAEIDDDPAVLDEAVRVLEELAGGVDPQAPDRAAYLDAAGSARLLRHDRLGTEDDLAAAITAAQQAVSLQREQGQLTAAALANLAGALFTAGIRRAVGGPELEQAEATAREALGIARAQAGTGGPVAAQVRDRLAGIESNLAGILLARAERSGDLGQLEETVRLCERAVAGSAPGSVELGLRAHQLAVARRTRYLRGGDPADLNAAVAAHELALGCPGTPFERPVLLDSWGNTLRTRFDRSGDVGDLRAAVAAYDEALGSPGAPQDRGARLNNLGGALAALAEAAGDGDAGDRARSVLTEAIRDAGPDSLERARALVNLGNVLAERYGRLGETADRDAALDAYRLVRRSSDVHAVSTESVLQAALNAGDWAVERADWADAADWLERALEAVEELVVVQRRRPDKESWLRDARGASIRAADAALRDRDPRRAAVLLERGRALLTSEAIQQAELDLDALDAAGAHDLRLRLEAAGGGAAWSEPTLIGGRRSTGTPMAADLRQLRDEIRRVPGFASFLAAPTFDDVAAAATPTPLVYLASSAGGGFALVVRRSGRSVTSVPLPALTDDAVRDRAEALLAADETYLSAPTAGRRAARQRRVRAFEQVSEWLWESAGAALAAELAEGAASVVAGGLLGLLPLHAASRPDADAPSGRHFLLDDVRISYVPNARMSSAAANRAGAVVADRLLAVAEPRPTALAPLPGTAAEAVVAAAGFGRSVVLPGPQANRDAVAEALRACDVVHFGCHGVADLTAPLRSAVLLRDDAPFTVADLLALRVSLRLAVLSACETAQPGTTLPDEVVSLPAALIQAGAAGVVATGWAVPDGPSAALVTEFYRRWRHADEDPGSALAGAQAWLRDTTNGEKVAVWEQAVEEGAAWLPAAAADALLDVYLLREPEAYDDAGIDVWAGFAYFGS